MRRLIVASYELDSFHLTKWARREGVGDFEALR